MSETAGPDDATRATPAEGGQPAPRPEYWKQRSAASRRPTANQQPRPAAPHTRRWVLPLALALCAIIAVAVVFLFVTRKSPTTPAVSSSSSARVSQGSSAPSEATASFPASVLSVCGGGTGHANEMQENLDARVRIHSDDGNIPGCAFVKKLTQSVDANVASNPQVAHFSQADTSERNTSIHYTDDCSRTAHLTTCRVLGSSPHNYVIYVRDKAV